MTLLAVAAVASRAMAVIRRVSVGVGVTVPVIPPDARDHDGQWQWEVLNPAGSGGTVELVDDPSKTIGAGEPLAPGAAPWTTLGRGVKVWAAGPATGSAVVVQVTGTPYGD